MSAAGGLYGLDILVPESRELDLFCRMLAAEGAVPHRCPLVTILDLDDPAPVEAWLDRLIAGAFDDLVLLTGEGLRRLIAVARRGGREADAVAAIGRLRVITRGPKPVRALREIGLVPSLQAATPTSDGVIALLADHPLAQRRIAVQLYPDSAKSRLVDTLCRRGAHVDAIVPYRYASDSETAAVIRAIEAMAGGAFDLVAFTSTPQVERMVTVAAEHGLGDALAAGLERTKVAAVGPVVADAVRRAGGRVDIEPAAFHLKPLVTAIGAFMAHSGEAGRTPA